MKPATIIHVAEVALDECTGMGRVASHWKKACESRGHRFIHIGPEQAGRLAHKALFPAQAYRAWLAMKLEADLFLVHEPASGAFVRRGVRTVVFSHGLERRGWELMLGGHADRGPRPGLKTRLLFPLWRLRNCDAGLRAADAALLINEEDRLYASRRYGLDAGRAFVFRNGVNFTDGGEISSRKPVTALFLGSWILRKGIRTLARAAGELCRQGMRINWIIAGAGVPESDVLTDWPPELHASTNTIPHFDAGDEPALLRRCDLFVLPSFFEGQPLALLQAMESGRCCITTDCCGQKDMIRHRENGLLHEPGDADALAQLIAESANGEALRRGIGSAARSSVRDRSWETVSAGVVRQIESVITEGRLPA